MPRSVPRTCCEQFGQPDPRRPDNPLRHNRMVAHGAQGSRRPRLGHLDLYRDRTAGATRSSLASGNESHRGREPSGSTIRSAKTTTLASYLFDLLSSPPQVIRRNPGWSRSPYTAALGKVDLGYCRPGSPGRRRPIGPGSPRSCPRLQPRQPGEDVRPSGPADAASTMTAGPCSPGGPPVNQPYWKPFEGTWSAVALRPRRIRPESSPIAGIVTRSGSTSASAPTACALARWRAGRFGGRLRAEGGPTGAADFWVL